MFYFGQAQSVKRQNRPLWIAKDRLCVHSGRRNRLESTLATLSQAKTQGLSLGGRLLMAAQDEANATRCGVFKAETVI